MAVTKEAFIRYRTIDGLLSHGKRATKAQLIAACTLALGKAISERTFYDDIKAMRSDEALGFMAPIEISRKDGYYYTDPTYSIEKLPFTPQQALGLQLLSHLLEQFGGVGIFSELQDTIESMVQRIQTQVGQQRHHLLVFEEGQTYASTRHISPLVEAIVARQVLRIQHRRFVEGEIKEHIVSPAFLKEYRNRWYLVGMLPDKPSPTIFGLERIEDMRPMPSQPYVAFPYPYADYFADIIGVTKTDSPVEDIELEVDELRAKYMKTMPLHTSQKLLATLPDGKVRFGLQVRCNFELENTLVGMGSECQVLKPESLRQRVLAAHRKALQKAGQ